MKLKKQLKNKKNYSLVQLYGNETCSGGSSSSDRDCSCTHWDIFCRHD